MKAKLYGIVIATLAIVFVVSLTVGSTVAYMSDSVGVVNNVNMGTVPETTAAPVVCVVAYDANGGIDAPGAQAAVQGEAMALSGQAPSHGEGYLFAGWAEDDAAEEAQYQPGESYTAHESVTLYAVWEE